MQMENEKNGIATPEKETADPRFSAYLEAIKRPDLKEKLSPQTPWGYWTMEIYQEEAGRERGIKGQGGLGMLASDSLEAAESLHIPSVFFTLFYTRENSQVLKDFRQQIISNRVTPEKRGFGKINEVAIKTRIEGTATSTKIDVYSKQEGSVNLVALTEPNIGSLYQGENNSDHRMYQEVVLGFGGNQVTEQLGIEPSLNQLNESPTVFSALARLDKLVAKKKNFEKSLREIREMTLYTNHTLVQAAEAEYSIGQFERFVIPNLESEELKDWLRNKISGRGGHIKLSTLAIELSGKRNGVSKLHAREAGKTYVDYDGNPVEFEGITNGITLKRWTYPELLSYYRHEGVLDKFDVPAEDFEEKLRSLDPKMLARLKAQGRVAARKILQRRKNQYGEQVDIPEDAKIYNWKRRLADYKRPDLLLDDPAELAEILEKHNAYLVMAGRAHPDDIPMQERLAKMLELVDKHPILKKRVHFVQNYDEVLARALAQGGDVSINTPRVRDPRTGERVSTEACGTSWEKDIIGNSILISTEDGGVADPAVEAEKRGADFEPAYLRIAGETEKDEAKSLYAQMRKAANVLEGKDAMSKEELWTRQLDAYLPTIAASRMETNYLNFGYPKDKK
jgi:alpha-glucan phosphorylase-like protein